MFELIPIIDLDYTFLETETVSGIYGSYLVDTITISLDLSFFVYAIGLFLFLFSFYILWRK